MRDLPQWVCWRHEKRDGKTTKVPYSPTTGQRARTDDPATWTTLTEAKRSAPDYDGIGFVFTAEDPFCGVDLDRCVNPETGEIEPWAVEIVDALDSYTEFSPSGTGLHIIVRAKLPEGRNRKGRVELYDRLRFFTVTGKRLDGTPSRIEERQAEVGQIHRELFPLEPIRNGHTPELSDDEVLRRAMSSANGERFVRLWEGDRTGYASDSEADLALCSMLAFWCGSDEGRITSLFSQSSLVREKWDREDYRRRTISRALNGMTDSYRNIESGIKVSSENLRNAGSSSSSIRPTLPKVAEFPTVSMPTSCQPLILEAEKALGCAPELVALPMLATLSSAIGTSRVVQVKGGWREWASLFVAVVASPGAMKTPAAKLAKKPAFEKQRRLGRNYTEEKEVWKGEVRQWEVEQRTARKNSEPAPEEPIPPTMERTVASDTTVEALVSILEDNPRGLLVHKDELAGWVRSMDQYKGGKGADRQHWLSFWSGDEVVVDRKSRMGEPIIVSKPFVSIFGGIQPAMLGELGAGAEDGLADRFLFVYPESRRIAFTDHEVSPEAESKYAALYESLVGLTLATDENGDPNPKPLSLTPKAKQLFAQQVNTLGAEAMEPGFPAKLEGVWAKLRGYLARLSLVLAVCRCVQIGVGDEGIEAEDVEAAAKLLAYFKAHAKRVYAELSSADPLDVLAGELRDLLRDSGGAWKGSPTELHEALATREAISLPDRPEELSKLALRIGERSPMLEVRQGWRKVGGRNGKTSRVLTLMTKASENAVGTVVPVGSRAESPAGDNGTNSTNGNSKEELPRSHVSTNAALDGGNPKNAVDTVVAVDPSSEYGTRDNGTNGDNGDSGQGQPGNNAPANATYATNASSGSSEDRIRFTV